MTVKYITGLVAAGILLGSVAAHAQSASLVNVDLRNARILNNIANDLSIDITNVPITVQVPLSLAANVCEVDVNVLAQSLERGTTTCTAQSTSNALNRRVQRVVNLNN
jgi:hypothetical protein